MISLSILPITKVKLLLIFMPLVMSLFVTGAVMFKQRVRGKNVTIKDTVIMFFALLVIFSLIIFLSPTVKKVL